MYQNLLPADEYPDDTLNRCLAADLKSPLFGVLICGMAEAGRRDHVVKIAHARLGEALRFEPSESSAAYMIGNALTLVGYDDLGYYTQLWEGGGEREKQWVCLQLGSLHHNARAREVLLHLYSHSEYSQQVNILSILAQNRVYDNSEGIAERIHLLPLEYAKKALCNFRRFPVISLQAISILRSIPWLDEDKEMKQIVRSLFERKLPRKK